MRLIIQHGSEWLSFNDPVEVLTARTPEEVFQCLEAIELRQSASRCKGDHLFQGLEKGEHKGLWAAGFVSYEAAGAFDDALKTHAPGDLPLLQFGLFEEPECVGHPEASGCRVSQAGAPAPQKNYQLSEWTPSVSRDEYTEAIASIKEHIAAGDTYQVNYTFRLNAGFDGDPFALFCDLTAAQQGRYGAYIETDEFAICSASPELFFELKDGTITSRPMKGTLPRGLTFSDDCQHAEALKNSPKDRAENIMIVDMIRNDIGRVAEAGSVETLSRFDVEKYPTVWQMTSTVQGKVNVDATPSSRQQCGKERDEARAVTPAKASTLGELLCALFPCASITGAPKAKTMEIIRELEKTPRGIYTGSIGFIAPNGDAQFNVAIRTAVVDRSAGVVEYGIGGGIVWDSDPESEYEEAITKSRILARRRVRQNLGDGRSPMPQRSCFELLETMLWEDEEIFLLERHLKRLAESAEYFDFSASGRSAENGQWLNEIRAELAALSFDEPKRLRLLLSKDGSFFVESQIYHTCASVINLAVAKEPVDSGDVFLYHKTTNRAVYERASSFAKATADKKADRPDADDVLLYNERGEVTESCIANVVVEIDGRKITPPVSCGLLAGTFRDELLESGEIGEGVVMLDDLKRADSIYLINSVRKWRKAVLR